MIKNDLVKEVARMLTEWESSDELASEFANRLVVMIRDRYTPLNEIRDLGEFVAERKGK